MFFEMIKDICREITTGGCLGEDIMREDLDKLERKNQRKLKKAKIRYKKKQICLDEYKEILKKCKEREVIYNRHACWLIENRLYRD